MSSTYWVLTTFIVLILTTPTLEASGAIFGLVQCDPNADGGPTVTEAVFGDDGDTMAEDFPADLTGVSCASALTELTELGYLILSRTTLHNLSFPPSQGKGNSDASAAADKGQQDILLMDLRKDDVFAQIGCNVFLDSIATASAAAGFPAASPVVGESCVGYLAHLFNDGGHVDGCSAAPPGDGDRSPASRTPFTEHVRVVYKVLKAIGLGIEAGGQAPPGDETPPPPVNDGR